MVILTIGGMANPFMMKAQTDVTSLYLKSADFTSNDGWTMAVEGDNNHNWAFNTSQKVAEAYGGWSKNTEITGYSLKQNITLPPVLRYQRETRSQVRTAEARR